MDTDTHLDLCASPPHPVQDGLGANGHVLEVDEALWQQFATAATTEAYAQSWLALQCRLIPHVTAGVVVLGQGEQGPLLPVAFWPTKPQHRTPLADAAERALLEGRGIILPREPSSDTPTLCRYHVAYPIHVTGQAYGVVALELEPRPESHLRPAMRQLQWGTGWLEVLYYRQRAVTPTVSPERPQLALELVATAVEQERFQAAATAFVTALATRLACDRVSLGCVRRGHVHLQAVSHSAHFGKKTNLARAIAAAMDEAYDQEAVIVYPAPQGGIFRMTHAHEFLARQHGVGALCSVPLSYDGDIVGVLTFERPVDHSFDAAMVTLCEVIAALAGPILEVHRREDRWLITKVAAALKTQLGRLFGPRYLVRKLVFLGLAAACAFFAVAQADYRVGATTVLEPALQRVVVAPFNGYIATAPMRAGDLIQAEQVLCTLDDRDLKLERLKWRSQREQYLKQYQQALAQRNAAQTHVVASQIAQAEAELALVEDQLVRTQVRTPFDGIVVTGDLSHSIGAPVERGHVLFEVAPLDTYRVIVQVDERDIASVVVGQEGSLVLMAFPDVTLPFTVTKITPVSTAREGRNYFRVEAQLAQTLSRLRPGMEGVGKIAIDRRLLLWIWTHQAVDWLRVTLWSWLS
jgi:multidrug resistance efflux pump